MIVATRLGSQRPRPARLADARPLYIVPDPETQVELDGPALSVSRESCAEQSFPLQRISRVYSAERVAAERAAQLANLSAEAKKLEALRVLLERDRAAGNRQAGGELAGSLVALLKEANENWPAAESLDLADLAEEIYGFIGWPASKKKEERQEQIAALRSRA